MSSPAREFTKRKTDYRVMDRRTARGLKINAAKLLFEKIVLRRAGCKYRVRDGERWLSPMGECDRCGKRKNLYPHYMQTKPISYDSRDGCALCFYCKDEVHALPLSAEEWSMWHR